MKRSALLVALSAASLASGIAFAQTYNQPNKPEATKPMGATTTPATPADPANPAAPTHPAVSGEMFNLSKLDRNGDGFVDREEARTSSTLSQIFDKADTNKDGKLDAAELNAASKAKQ